MPRINRWAALAFWYQCPGSQGPNVDQYGRWVIDATKFPVRPAARLESW